MEMVMGSWFGEACLFYKQAVHEMNAVAVVETELAVLTARDYRRIAKKYKQMEEKHLHLEQSLKNGDLEPNTLAYQPPLQMRHQASLRALPKRFGADIFAKVGAWASKNW